MGKVPNQATLLLLGGAERVNTFGLFDHLQSVCLNPGEGENDSQVGTEEGLQQMAGRTARDILDTLEKSPEPVRFTVEKRRKRPNAKPVIDEKAAWTAEQWREWFALECAIP